MWPTHVQSPHTCATTTHPHTFTSHLVVGEVHGCPLDGVCGAILPHLLYGEVLYVVLGALLLATHKVRGAMGGM